MTVIVDTQILLWSQAESKRLPAWLKDVLEQPDEPPFFSVASLWEIAIKSALNKQDFNYDAETVRKTLLRLGWRELEITGEHVLTIGNLPLLHSDSFDRLLIAQAKVAGFELITADMALAKYGQPVRLIKPLRR